MIFSPDDHGVNLVGAAINGPAPSMTTLMIFALSTGRESPQEMLRETRELLRGVDAATTVALNQLRGDENISAIARHWAFFGPGIFNQLERLDGLENLDKNDLMVLASANAFLVARKLTFELNGVAVCR